MHKIGSTLHMNHIQNCKTVKRSNAEFDNTLKEQDKDELKESSTNKNSQMTNEEFWKLVKGSWSGFCKLFKHAKTSCRWQYIFYVA